jgi:hypothetical protein
MRPHRFLLRGPKLVEPAARLIGIAYFPFAFSPISTSLRIASDREGRSAFFRRHSSIAATSSEDIITGIRWSFIHSVSKATAHLAQVG